MIVWIDTETSGLNEHHDHLLEIALVVTDDDLKELDATSYIMRPRGQSIEWVIGKCDPVVRDMHTKNGLFQEIVGGSPRCYEVEEKLIPWVRLRVESPKDTPLAGSTIGFDRRFMREHMASLEGLFSHRSIDVSSLTELARRWAPSVYEQRPKADKAHRALADVRKSIDYLRHYRKCGFVGA